MSGDTEEKTTSSSTESLSDQELRQQLTMELDNLIKRIQAMSDYSPPPYSPGRLKSLLEKGGQKMPSGLGTPFKLRKRISRRLEGLLGEDILDPDTWKGAWYMLNYSLEYQADFVKRRLTGDYETDDWGLDWEFVEVVRPFFDFLYNTYWRVEVSGIEHIPEDGPALLVANHSSQIPWDGFMIASAVYHNHPDGRLVRSLYEDWLPKIPFIAVLLERSGHTLYNVDNGTRLLAQNELVAVYPEGVEGLRKTFKDRYKLTGFGQGDFIKMAFATEAPIIPVSIVGADETYITFTQSRILGKLVGISHLPVSFTFPWLGLLGLVPLPTKWFIDFGQPFLPQNNTSNVMGESILMTQLAEKTHRTLQHMVNKRLAKRRSVFLG